MKPCKDVRNATTAIYSGSLTVMAVTPKKEEDE